MDSWATDLHMLKLSIVILLFTACPVAVKASSGEYKPVGGTEYRVVEGGLWNGSGGGSDYARRRLAPFQLCLLCKCCSAGAGSTCTSMPCCFGIDCQLPNKPFGVCAFVPKTCNCNSCAG